MKNLLLAACCLAASACTTASPAPPAAPASSPAEAPKPRATPPGVDLAAMNERIAPCDDFYAYACGGWLASTPMAEDEVVLKRGYTAISERQWEAQRHLLEEAARDESPERPASWRKLGDFYSACMDEARLEQALPALKEWLARATDVRDARTLARALGQLHLGGHPLVFQLAAVASRRDSRQMVAELSLSGLGLSLPDHLEDNAAAQAMRAAHGQHIQRDFVLLGQTPKQAARSAARVMDLERDLAQAIDAWSDPQDAERWMDLSGLRSWAPGFPWEVYFAAAGLQELQAFKLLLPLYFQEVARSAGSAPPETWKAYLTWHFLQDSLDLLPRPFRDSALQFERQAHGFARAAPRWKQCVKSAQGALGESLAQAFSARTLDPESQTEALRMMRDIGRAFEHRLDTLTWMDAPTRARARNKARAITYKIAFPDRWRLEDGLEVQRDSFVESSLNAKAFHQARRLARLGRAVDRTEWLISPLEVNASYQDTNNEVYVLAGLLQPPLFSKAFTVPVNLGSLGATMGHEFIHGFDDHGRHYDARGNWNPWWTAASDRAFGEQVQCIKRQYSSYRVLDDMKVDGAFTLNENLADLGGLHLAHAALQEWLVREPESARRLARYRFTPEQQFFIAAAQSRCSQYREAYRRYLLPWDPHAPDPWRVNGPLSNMPEFQRAFQCPASSRMVRSPAQRCQVW